MDLKALTTPLSGRAERESRVARIATRAAVQQWSTWLGTFDRMTRTLLVTFLLAAVAVTVAVDADAQPADLAAMSQQAKQAMQTGNYSAAISLYKQLTKALPDNPGIAFNLGLALHSAGEYAPAVQQFERVTKLQPQIPAAWFMLGIDFQKLNRPADAIRPLEHCLKADPSNGAARLELGDALFSTRRFSDAATAFGQLAETDASNPKVWLGLGLAWSSLAGEAFDNLQDSFPDSVYLQLLAAQSRADQHQYRSAYQLYRQALKVDPGLLEAHQAIAEIYRATGHADWAKAENNLAHGFDSSDCVNTSLRCLYLQGQYAQLVAAAKPSKTAESFYWQARAYRELAMAAQQKLTDLPPSAELHQMMAIVYDMRELYPDAAREWRETLKLQPENRNFKRKLAWSLSGSGEWTATAEIAKELLAAEPDSAELRRLMGDALLNLQQPEQALPHLKKAVLLDPANPASQASLGRSYLLIGDSQNAIPHLEKALSADRDGTLLYQLAQAYRALGQREKAAAILAQYKNRKAAFDARKTTQEEENQITPPGDSAR